MTSMEDVTLERPSAKEGNRYAYAGGSLCFPRSIWLGTCGGGT